MATLTRGRPPTSPINIPVFESAWRRKLPLVRFAATGGSTLGA
jgi:hypothetical protein